MFELPDQEQGIYWRKHPKCWSQLYEVRSLLWLEFQYFSCLKHVFYHSMNDTQLKIMLVSEVSLKRYIQLRSSQNSLV